MQMDVYSCAEFDPQLIFDCLQSDFGLAKRLEPPPLQPAHAENVVTLWYRAPELLLGGRQHESQMQSIGFVPPISWSTTEGNTWPEYVWLPDTAAQVWAKLTANIPAAVLRAIKLGLIPPGSCLLYTSPRPRD